MRVQMLTRACGDNLTAGPGDIVDVPAKLAKELVDGHYATRVEAAKDKISNGPEVNTRSGRQGAQSGSD